MVTKLGVATQAPHHYEKVIYTHAEPLYHASTTLCGGHVFILGGYDELKKPTRVVYTCSLTALLECDVSYKIL